MLTDIPDQVRGRAAPRGRRVRRIAPLAAAIGVIIAATVGLVLQRINVPAPNQPAVSNVHATLPTH